MIFEFAETRCISQVLGILHKGKSKYPMMFKETKASHTTLQRVLKKLAQKGFVERKVKDHRIVDYTITDKGKKLLKNLEGLKKLLA